VAAKLTEPLQQLRFVQDFFHNPLTVNLGTGPIESSAPPAEIMGRMSEIKYHLDVLAALQAVLKDEMEELKRALPSERPVEGPQPDQG
jgi:hypothetical protein